MRNREGLYPSIQLYGVASLMPASEKTTLYKPPTGRYKPGQYCHGREYSQCFFTSLQYNIHFYHLKNRCKRLQLNITARKMNNQLYFYFYFKFVYKL